MGRYVRPTRDTKFHIDFDWWVERGRSLRVLLQDVLCDACRAAYADSPAREVDWVDPETGEVKRVGALMDVIRTHCGGEPGYLTPQTPLAAAVFRILLANNNTPLTAVEMHTIVGRKTPNLILRILAGRQVHYGIKPVTMPVRGKRKVAA